MCYSGNNTQPAQKSPRSPRSLTARRQPLPQKANLGFAAAALTGHVGDLPLGKPAVPLLPPGGPQETARRALVSTTGQGPGSLCESRRLIGFLSNKRGLYRNGNRECRERREGLGVSIGTPWGLLSLPQEAFNTSPAGSQVALSVAFRKYYHLS